MTPTADIGPDRGSRATTNAKGDALKQERALRTREAVLNAAAQAFADKGFPSVTVLDVAQLAGVTKGAVYFHFANKEGLALAVADAFYRRLPRMAQEVTSLGLSARDTVTELLTRTAVAFADDIVTRAGARLQIERAFIDAALPTPYVDYGEMLTALLVQAQRDGEVTSEIAPEVLSRVLVSAFFGAQHISWVLNDRQDIRERVDEVLAVVLRRS
ncbi:ScbR family autoregulator-binding transcription factor [Streptacidiphilus sp. MAP5-3]|uniref:ScbR family autoregulator-binding transcription factor n=1 Tax=unclassified Streptacidiphilus TaxID=2643834 RepID=UPI0035124B3B